MDNIEAIADIILDSFTDITYKELTEFAEENYQYKQWLDDLHKDIDQICQLFEPKPELKLKVTPIIDAQGLPRMRGEFVPKPSESRLISETDINHLIGECMALGSDWMMVFADKLIAKTASIKDAENRELGLLLESEIGGVEETNDWSPHGLREFRPRVLLIIKQYCEKLKAGRLGILSKYLDERDAECQARVEGIKREIAVIIKGEFSKARDIQICLKSLLDAWGEEGI